MHKFLITTGLLLCGAVLGAGVFWLSAHQRTTTAALESATDAHEPAASAEPPRLSHNPAGETVVRFETETQQRVGLKVQAVAAATHQPQVAAYGLLQEDPAQAFVLRAPVAGILRAASTWPDLHQHMEADTLVGYVQPRLTQTERIDLATRLMQARADASEAEAALATARSSYENKKKLNAESKAVSDRALEEADSKVKSEAARLTAARNIVNLLEAAQSTGNDPQARFELRTEQTGEVVEASTRPGEAVEAGQILLRLARFDTLVARVEVPLGQPFDAAAATARVVPVGAEIDALAGQKIGLATANDSAAHGPTLLFRIATAGTALRPGAAVVANLPAPGGLQSGVTIPRSAVIRLLGKAWAYVQSDEESFTRRELLAAESTDEGWFVTQGFSPGDEVVTDGVQVLLSEELKAQIEKEAAATE